MSEWIKVEDRLPYPYDYVLVYCSQEPGIMSIARYNGVEWEMLSTEQQSNAWMKGDLTWFMYPSEITHWMEIPDNPRVIEIKKLS